MRRRYTDAPTIRKILQTIWYQVNNGQEIYVIGRILDDGTVQGGTGWGAEFAKLCNKPLYVFDQERDGLHRDGAGTLERQNRSGQRGRRSGRCIGRGFRAARMVPVLPHEDAERRRCTDDGGHGDDLELR